jgi:hypothetical protein
MVIGVEVPDLRIKFDFAAVMYIEQQEEGLLIVMHSGFTFVWPAMTYDKWCSLEKSLALQMNLQQR